MLRPLLISLMLGLSHAAPAHAEKDPCKGVQSDGMARTYEASGLTWHASGDRMEMGVTVSKAVGFMAALRKKTERGLPSLEAGASVTVTLSDGSTLSLRSAAAAPPSVSVMMGALINHYELTLPLTDEQWNTVATRGIATVTLDDDVEYAVEPSRKVSDRFAEAGRCLVRGDRRQR